MKNMNRQDAKSAKEKQDLALQAYTANIWSEHAPTMEQLLTVDLLGALGVPVERVFKRILAVKKVLP
jgi:hypothetical protein